MRRIFNLSVIISFIIATASVQAQSDSSLYPSLNQEKTETRTENTSTEYSLVWSDEFTESQIDTSVWNFWEGTAYNNELQYYTDRPENIFIDDGKLHIRAQKEDYGGMNYTSARISTDSTSIGWKYGRFEAKIKMPDGKGYWPAFWLMPIREIGWPRGGEIDIMEFRGNEPNTTTGAIHFYREGCEGSSVECRKYITDSITQADTNLTEEFHVYALEWTEEELVWYLDNTEFMKIKLNDVKAEYNPFSTPFYIILNLAVGGDFLDNPDESTPFPQSLVVDYVRVYQKD